MAKRTAAAKRIFEDFDPARFSFVDLEEKPKKKKKKTPKKKESK